MKKSKRKNKKKMGYSTARLRNIHCRIIKQQIKNHWHQHVNQCTKYRTDKHRGCPDRSTRSCFRSHHLAKCINYCRENREKHETDSKRGFYCSAHCKQCLTDISFRACTSIKGCV